MAIMQRISDSTAKDSSTQPILPIFGLRVNLITQLSIHSIFYLKLSFALNQIIS
jgi:hypothetical protein